MFLFVILAERIWLIGAAGVGWAFSRVYLFVRALKGKRLDLSAQKSVDI